MDRAKPIVAYDQVASVVEARAARQKQNRSQPGNPDLAATALLEALDSDNPLFRMLLGSVAFEAACEHALPDWRSSVPARMPHGVWMTANQSRERFGSSVVAGWSGRVLGEV